MGDNFMAWVEIIVLAVMFFASLIVSIVLNVIKIKRMYRGEHVSKGLKIVSIVLPIYSVISIFPSIMLYIYLL